MYKRVLTIQDISCLGQCSGTVALPLISACGHECCIIPSSVLSTHTGGFTGFTFKDLTEEMPKIRQHWEKEGLFFDCVYTGYLGSARQIDYVSDIMDSRLKEGGLRIVDPAMADNGKLYTGFDMEFVSAMRQLCAGADYLLPNITEAALLTGMEYKNEYDEGYVINLCRGLEDLGAGKIILTGVKFEPGTTGVYVHGPEGSDYYKHKEISSGCHGTGDVYASVFTGALMGGKSDIEAARTAADFVVECITGTRTDPDHSYGVKFEPEIPKLIKMLGL